MPNVRRMAFVLMEVEEQVIIANNLLISYAETVASQVVGLECL
jgi:hypothetical protein